MCTSSTGGGSDCGGEKLLVCSVANFVFDRSLANFTGSMLQDEFVSLLKRGIIIVLDIFILFTMHLNLNQSKKCIFICQQLLLLYAALPLLSTA